MKKLRHKCLLFAKDCLVLALLFSSNSILTNAQSSKTNSLKQLWGMSSNNNQQIGRNNGMESRSFVASPQIVTGSHLLEDTKFYSFTPSQYSNDNAWIGRASPTLSTSPSIDSTRNLQKSSDSVNFKTSTETYNVYQKPSQENSYDSLSSKLQNSYARNKPVFAKEGADKRSFSPKIIPLTKIEGRISSNDNMKIRELRLYPDIPIARLLSPGEIMEANKTSMSKENASSLSPKTQDYLSLQSDSTERSFLSSLLYLDSSDEEVEGRKQMFKKYRRYMVPLLIAYKLKFFTLIPVMIGGLVLLVGTTGLAGFFFALFAAVMGLRGFHQH